jgi:hypothetical protein
MIDFEKLREPFPVERVSWRIGSKVVNGQAVALAYVDARDVMERLDEVCGPLDWQCRYDFAGDKTVCEIGLRTTNNYKLVNGEEAIEYEWVWKADGAGDTDIESTKGALSDAFKRSAVRWGIGRYLYSIETPWVAVTPDGKYISEDAKEYLYTLLPNNTGGLKVNTLAGQSKQPAKFWDNKSYNILAKVPKTLQNPEGDPEWINPDMAIWAFDTINASILKAPSRLALTKLHADNTVWLGNLDDTSREAVTDAFRVRAEQFDQLRGKDGK